MKKEKDWIRGDKKYLFEMQKFISLTENIQDETLRKNIIEQMLICQQHLIEKFEKQSK